MSTATVRSVVKEEKLPAVRRFERSRPNELWQSDITGLWLARSARRLYLTVFLDDYSRYVVGFGVATHQRRELVLEAFGDALGALEERDDGGDDDGRTDPGEGAAAPRVPDAKEDDLQVDVALRCEAGRRLQRRMERDVPEDLPLRARRRRERGSVLRVLEEEKLISRRRGDGFSVLVSSAGVP